MTRTAYNSIVSEKHILDVMVDTRLHEKRTGQKWDLASKWNDFFQWWSGQDDYDYLFYVSDDNILSPLMVDYLVEYFETYATPDTGIVSCKQINDLDIFNQNKDKVVFSTSETPEMDASSFMIKKGVVERVGEMDPLFPLEFLDRDYFYRVRLAGFRTVGLDMPLIYHPTQSMTVNNPTDRMEKALRRYKLKWGGDALKEQYLHPYNDMNLDFTFIDSYEGNI